MKTDPNTPEQAEWLQHYEAALAESPAVLGYAVLDPQGGILSEKTRDLPDGVDLETASTWVQNAYHAIDAYYPESSEVFLRFQDYNVILCRAHELIAIAVLDPSYELKAFNDLLSGERLKRLASRLRSATPAAGGAAPVKRSETVFLKISDDSGTAPAGAPAASRSGTQPATATPTRAAKRSNSTPLILIGGAAVVALLAMGGAIFFAMGSKSAPEPVPAAPVVQPTPEPAVPVDFAAQAARMRAEATELGQLARQPAPSGVNSAPLVAKGFAAASAAEAASSNGQHEEALRRWTEARDAYGQAALQSAEARLNHAEQAVAIRNPENYAQQTWGEIQQNMEGALQARDRQDFREAVRLTRTAAEGMERLPAALQREILGLARTAATTRETATAEIFYRDLLRLDPKNAEAAAFLHRFAAEPGTTIENSVGMQLALIPAGTFTMGSPTSEARRDADEIVHEVTLTEPFFMGTTEVTQAQWRAVMGEGVAVNDEGFAGPDLPVHSVSWEQAKAFADKLSELEGHRYRLPTEAEWEYAARAGSKSAFSSGPALDGTQAQVYDQERNPANAPAPVGSFTPNAWGLYDLHGNVWEWTADWFGPYASEAVENPTGATQDSFSRIDLALKALRGGSWYDEADKARSANRWGSSPSAGANYIGFRVVRDVDPYAPEAP
ncbi:MAG: SUMF1/EgtB/PvdO family nonheme iron enzyme [Verrucomicrobiota bacterium JB022]|nr:SUMF1/EgtB/PvdO family nonheme iron enzyme [Verrucomicrobiota bacterium JB022]